VPARSTRRRPARAWRPPSARRFLFRDIVPCQYLSGKT
jgi:hypothetical protein